MTNEELREHFRQRKPSLKALGKLVVSEVEKALKERIGDKAARTYFSIPPTYRVKETEGFMEKCQRVGKSYSDPLNEITDQVGVRFVVLRFDQVALLNEIVRAVEGWTRKKARDMVEEREANPHHFDYVSDHWVVSLLKPVSFDECIVPAGLGCEVQIRTLLQHAYAELAHSTVYKPNLTAKPDVKRIIARGAALIETTDNVFVEVGQMIENESQKFESLLEAAALWCRDNSVRIERDCSFPATLRIFDAYSDIFSQVEWAEIESLIESKGWLPSKLKSNKDLPLHNREVIVLVYWLVMKLGRDVAQRWPLDLDYLRPAFTALNISSSGSLD